MYVTELNAIDPRDGQLKNWCGPNVPGISFEDARWYCDNNGLGYLRVVGELVAEIPCKPGSFEADFSKKIDYDNLN